MFTKVIIIDWDSFHENENNGVDIGDLNPTPRLSLFSSL